ncbi:MAG TPA: metal-dependent hydrolase [Acidimicrobiales bacterium]|nr:metal-dependent hydrolase [Acidimicrobiales bacterium]
MLLWFAGLSVVIVWLVFRDTAIDYRLVMAGALLPDVVDTPFGGARALHTVAASAVLLAVVMVATRGRRAARRRLLALPVGTLLHLVLDGMWASPRVFWWPLQGWSFPGEGLPSSSRPLAVILLQEVAGAAALVAGARRFRLDQPERRRTFLRTGRLGRDLVT